MPWPETSSPCRARTPFCPARRWGYSGILTQEVAQASHLLTTIWGGYVPAIPFITKTCTVYYTSVGSRERRISAVNLIWTDTRRNTDRCSAMGLLSGLFQTNSRRSNRGILLLKWGGILVKKGHCIEYTGTTYQMVELRGHIPPNCGRKGGSLCTLLRHGAVSPNNRPTKKQNVSVPGMSCGRLASPS